MGSVLTLARRSPGWSYLSALIMDLLFTFIQKPKFLYFTDTIGIIWWINKATVKPNPKLTCKKKKFPSSYFSKSHSSSSSTFGIWASSVNTMQLLARAKERPVLTSQIWATPHLSWTSAKTRETTWQFENSGVLWAILHNLEMCLATAHAIKMRGKSPKHSCKIVQGSSMECN